MNRIFVFIGESGCGKTTIITELVKRHPNIFKKVVTCTSRKKRANEIEGQDYHFLSTEHFFSNPDLVLVKNSDPTACYGTRLTDLKSETHHLLITSKLTGVSKLRDLGFYNLVVVNIYINKKLKIQRMRNRGDSYQMIYDRIKSDQPTVLGLELNEIRVISIDANQTIDEEISAILECVNG
jgi:guanylate kinase